MKRKICYGFTLAEVLITLAIIGVVAALSIPAVISNSQQQEFKTGLRKAVSVLNSAITMNMAIDGESPYDNVDLYNYLMRHMSVIKSGKSSYISAYIRPDGTWTSRGKNYSFYTTDGIKFEFDDDGNNEDLLKLHESDISACLAVAKNEGYPDRYLKCGGCGSYGLAHNPNNTTKPPCAIMVDVNGDRRPNPANINAVYETDENGNIISSATAQKASAYKIAYPGSKLIGDIFTILITEDRAIPYGVVAQKAMYGAQKQGF